MQKVIDEDDQKLSTLTKELGEEAYVAVVTALKELNEYNESERSVRAYEARTHQVDGVSACPTQVGHRRSLNTSTTRVRHAVLCVPFKKYYLSAQTRVGHNRIWLGHALHMARTGVVHDWTQLGYGLNTI